MNSFGCEFNDETAEKVEKDYVLIKKNVQWKTRARRTCCSVSDAGDPSLCSRLGREQHGLGGQRLHDGGRGKPERPHRLLRLGARHLGDRGAKGESGTRFPRDVVGLPGSNASPSSSRRILSDG